MTTNEQTQNQDGLQLRDILDLIWRLRYWIALSAFVALILGFWYARMQNPVYQRSTTTNSCLCKLNS